MLRYLLDTNICIDVIKRRPSQMLDHFNRHSRHMAISAFTTGRSALAWSVRVYRSA
jgi:tRNA(fMet)-specific endonuclease VapC